MNILTTPSSSQYWGDLVTWLRDTLLPRVRLCWELKGELMERKLRTKSQKNFKFDSDLKQKSQIQFEIFQTLSAVNFLIKIWKLFLNSFDCSASLSEDPPVVDFLYTDRAVGVPAALLSKSLVDLHFLCSLPRDDPVIFRWPELVLEDGVKSRGAAEVENLATRDCSNILRSEQTKLSQRLN